jgi:hypothetical protein
VLSILNMSYVQRRETALWSDNAAKEKGSSKHSLVFPC